MEYVRLFARWERGRINIFSQSDEFIFLELSVKHLQEVAP